MGDNGKIHQLMLTHEKFSINRRAMLKVSGALAASALLAGCARSSESSTTQVPPTAPGQTITLMQVRQDFTEQQEAQFKAEYPHIPIVFLEADLTRFFALYAAGTPPDLYRCQVSFIPQALRRALLYDLTPYFEKSTLCKPNDLADANHYFRAESPFEVGQGKLYGMCKDFSPDFTIFANLALFKQASLPAPGDHQAMTYREIMDISKIISRFETNQWVTLGYEYEAAWIDRIWMNMLAESGKSLFTSDFKKIQIANEEVTRQVVQYYFALAKEKLTSSPQDPSPHGWFGSDFSAGILGLAQFGYWYSAMAESDANRGSVVMLPGPTWSGERRNPTVTAAGMVITSATRFPDAAWTFFEWYNGGQPSLERARSGWAVPALKSQMSLMPQNTDLQKQAFQVLVGELALKNSPIQFNPFIGESTVAEAWNRNLKIALTNDLAFDALIANLEAEVNTFIQENA